MGGYLLDLAGGSLSYPAGLDIAGVQQPDLWKMHDLDFFFAR